MSSPLYQLSYSAVFVIPQAAKYYYDLRDLSTPILY